MLLAIYNYLFHKKRNRIPFLKRLLQECTLYCQTGQVVTAYYFFLFCTSALLCVPCSFISSIVQVVIFLKVKTQSPFC